jgi:hypothetical protein
MESMLLSETNPYLRDKVRRTAGLLITVCSSSAIEGIAAEDFMNDYVKKKAESSKSIEPVRIVK